VGCINWDALFRIHFVRHHDQITADIVPNVDRWNKKLKPKSRSVRHGFLVLGKSYVKKY
jgi:hypothetical protein